jgi:hypothetical protein
MKPKTDREAMWFLAGISLVCVFIITINIAAGVRVYP